MSGEPALLCEAIRDYDFPAVTYDFTEEKELHHDSMLAVEQYIGALLRSKDLSAVKDGLSNVLYWGYAQQPGWRDFKVSDFRKTIPDPERDPKLDQFAQLIRSGRPDLVNIKKRQLCQFSQISFVSKILMVLDPTRYPVLDLKIANAFAKSSFLPLQNLTFAQGGIRITERNARPPTTPGHAGAATSPQWSTKPLCLRAAASELSMSKEPSSPWRTHRQRTRPACFWTARQAGRSIGDRHRPQPVEAFLQGERMRRWSDGQGRELEHRQA